VAKVVVYSLTSAFAVRSASGRFASCELEQKLGSVASASSGFYKIALF